MILEGQTTQRSGRKPLKKTLVIISAAAIAAAILLAAAFSIGKLIKGGSDKFAGDEVLTKAASDLADADRKLLLSPNDEAAHLERAQAWLEFGYLEGARLEWQKRPTNAQEGWGDLGRSLDDLESKMNEIRRQLQDAESSALPAQKYPPIYAMLDDIATRYTGIPKYRALFLRGYMLLREGRKAEAEPVFAGELTHYFPLKAYVAYDHATSLMVAGSEDKALDELNRFIDQNRSNRLAPLAHLERINQLRDLGRTADAIEECRRALDSYPTSPFAAKILRKMAEMYESGMDFDHGVRARLRILREFADSDEARDTKDKFFGGVYDPAQLGEADRLDVAYASADLQASDALPILSALADSQSLSNEQKAKACLGAGQCEYRLGHYFEAINWYTKATGLAPASEWSDRGGIRSYYAYKNLNKTDLARQSLWQVAQGRGPMASTAADIVWKAAYEASDLQMVDQACRLIVDEYPTSDETPAAMTMLAYLGCRSGQYQTGRGYAERCARNFPDNLASAEAGFWLARSLSGLGQDSASRDAYKQLAERVPWSYWGIRASELTQLPPQSDKALDPMAFNPQNLSVYDGNLATAWELYDTGVLDLAESEFRQALDEGKHGAQCGLALILAEQGDIQTGSVTLRAAALKGDQAFLTPARQKRILDILYPRPYADIATTAALAHDVPVSWLWGAMRQESCFNPRAHSGSGACGLIQIMPETGRFIAAQRGASSFNPSILWDPATNLDYSAWYFAYLGNLVGNNLSLVMASYNGGPGRIQQWREQLPIRDDDIFVAAMPREETRNFAQWVYGNVKMYERILREKNTQLVPF